MTPPVEFQHPVVHGLGAQLDGGDAVLPQKGKHLRLHGVGTGGEPDTPHRPRPDIGKGSVQQPEHIPPVDGGETSAKEGDLRLSRPAAQAL